MLNTVKTKTARASGNPFAFVTRHFPDPTFCLPAQKR
jgi:hypothetical protein